MGRAALCPVRYLRARGRGRASERGRPGDRRAHPARRLARPAPRPARQNRAPRRRRSPRRPRRWRSSRSSRRRVPPHSRATRAAGGRRRRAGRRRSDRMRAQSARSTNHGNVCASSPIVAASAASPSAIDQLVPALGTRQQCGQAQRGNRQREIGRALCVGEAAVGIDRQRHRGGAGDDARASGRRARRAARAPSPRARARDWRGRRRHASCVPLENVAAMQGDHAGAQVEPLDALEAGAFHHRAERLLVRVHADRFGEIAVARPRRRRRSRRGAAAR